MKLKNFSLDNKTALITGSAGLLGIQHAAALLECGAKVVLTDISENALDNAKSALCGSYEEKKIFTTVMDVSNQTAIIEASCDLRLKGIKVDILINNAAIDPKVKDGKGLVETSRLEFFSLEQWNLEIGVGLTGAFLTSKVFGSEMVRNSTGGVILNIASDLSVISPDQRLYREEGVMDDMQPTKPVTYSVIKAGLVGLTKYLATYWAQNGIRCNALSPGGVFNSQSEEFVRRVSSLIPLGRMANIDEYQAAVQFLCSDASSYLNGQNIVMDGGRSIW